MQATRRRAGRCSERSITYRQQLNMSQKEFASRFGFSLDALQNWEQRRRFPDSTARVLLKVIEHNPDVVEDALAMG